MLEERARLHSFERARRVSGSSGGGGGGVGPDKEKIDRRRLDFGREGDKGLGLLGGR